MKKFAVIDIGSNSVRLMFVADGKVLYKRLKTTRLGENIAQTSRLKGEAIERTAIAVAEFYAMAKSEGAKEVLAFATAAVRSAENGKEFTDRVNALCGLFIEVVSGETEAELGILGALGKADGCVLDIGGASTELVARKSGKTVYKKSVNVGVVRLKDTCGREVETLKDVCHSAVKAFEDFPCQDTLYAIGGTATTLASVFLGLTEYDPDRITGTVLSCLQIQELADKLSKMTVEEISAMPCMPKGRADVLSGGAVWLSVLTEELQIEKIIVSDRDNLEGYAIWKGLLV